MLRHIHSPDRGAGYVEYGAVIALVSCIVLAVFTMGAPGRVQTLYESAICRISPESESGDCLDEDGDTEPVAAPQPQKNPEGSQTAVPSPDSPEGPQETYFSVANFPTEDGPGGEEDADESPEFTPGEIGEPGSVPDGEAPELPEFIDGGANSGEYNSEPLEFWQVFRGNRLAFLQTKYAAAATGGGLMGAPHAQEYLQNFLDNTGSPVDLPVETILEEVPSFETAVDIQRRKIGADAVQKAIEMGIDESTTFPFSTPWEAHNTNSGESRDWYYALGSWQYAQTGTVTVSPPMGDSDVWTYTVESDVHVQKEYDWDPKKKVGPGGVFDQSELAELHRAGLAQEFSMSGSTPYTGRGAYVAD